MIPLLPSPVLNVVDLCVIPVAAVANVKGFDEDSVASLSTTQDETQDSHVAENGINNSSAHPFQGGYMLAASYWPKVNDETHTRAILIEAL